MTTILVVDDEHTLRETLAFNLRREEFDVVEAADGQQALDIFATHAIDLVLLDVMLPQMNGTEVCRKIRKTSSVPIIMVSAKDSEIDKVVGLEIGADDYITKPYSYRELLARVRALLRRVVPAIDDDGAAHVLTVGPVTLDSHSHVVSVNGSEVAMPLREFELLEFLMENAGRVLTRSQIFDRIWGAGYIGDSKTLDVHIKRLRSKIEQVPAEPQLLVTVRGLGYKFVAK
ncbi:two-component system, OmpR family, response regulator RegX3 [Arcanobacterium phocae]|uniref:Sensory transduction protein RegX3 n=1 Tax=Arcanobacterium phocae TaxID=131112 RepID=A0A1H2LFN7_9ACTO|nr:response regulator transcription factor [Arcanobacterium phocae]SDU79837.1 two-component system, OmpR family, response regulator RegX3 [Arcanobacterium phocae]